MDWLSEALTQKEILFRLRRAFHRWPEQGNGEFRTAERIERILHTWGIETFRPLETAVVGWLSGSFAGKTLALRADMDALPISEATGVPFASQNSGWMHACGHDVHITALLGAAKLLSRHRETLHGTVKFFFQPDEEGEGGAARMIAAGCMEGVSAVFGAHVSPELPLGTVGVRFGRFYAASDRFQATVIGKNAHGAEPEKGIDALAAAAEMVCALHNFSKENCVLTVGTFRAGTAENILAGEATFSGIFRTLTENARQRGKAQLRRILTDIAKRRGTELTLHIQEGYAGVVNAAAATELVRETAVSLFGREKVVTLSAPTMMTEDFGCFSAASDGSFFHMGTGRAHPLHSPFFLPEEEILPLLSALYAAIAERYLSDF